MSNSKKIAVLGAGSWGTALTIHLARKNYAIYLWQKNADEAQAIQSTRVNQRYLPTFTLSENITCSSNIVSVCVDAEVIVVATPSHAFRSVLALLKPFLKKEQIVIWACKGLDPETNQLLDRVAEEILADHQNTAVLSGPNFASEIAQGLPAATTIASKNAAILPTLIDIFKSDQLRVYGTSDVAGVEICGVLKNVMAIAVGISDGLAMGANARAALITRGLAEITRLALALGAKPETMMGLAGMGDLILTCTDDKSRNRRFGKFIGQNMAIDVALKEVGQVVEGYQNVKQAHLLAQQYHIDMPITEQIYHICYQGVSPLSAAKNLMQR